MIVLLIANVLYGVSVIHPLLLYLPLLLLIQMALIAGIGLAAAAMNVFYRDIDPLLKLTTQVWFYASPILYPVSAVPLDWQAWYLLNPMAGIVTAYRSVLLHHEPPGYDLYWAAAISLVTLLAGYRLFRATESQFADVL
jgi:lipopolysaccharide transport system permease protein